jgi:hypothetical protein
MLASSLHEIHLSITMNTRFIFGHYLDHRLEEFFFIIHSVVEHLF